MRKIVGIFTILFLLIFSTSKVYAIYDPTSVANNKYGIHIMNETDLSDAANLVNSQGGDWGYVTVVITEGERDHDRWQKAFDQMRRLHLIPLVRIATKASGDTWDIPSESEIDNWVNFFNSLNWVTENRYVIILNEPNHALEWGGKIDPAAYAKYLKEFSQKLKSSSSDYYILPAGLDASAKNTKDTMDETLFIRGMVKSEPDIFDFVDGWTSHSYPNPAFSGKETDTGRGSVTTFDWEISYLKSLGINKNLPVFITETGWSNKTLSESDISTKLKYAFQNVWNDPRVTAVTPFILNYTTPPFDQFSWKKSDGSFTQFYQDIKNLSKTAGSPRQIESGTIFAAFSQPLMLPDSDFAGAILAKNTGQSIWSTGNLSLGSASNNLVIRSMSFNNIEPLNLGLIIFRAAAPSKTGLYGDSIFIKNSKGEKISNNFSFEGFIVKPDLVQIQAFFGRIGSDLQNLAKF